MRTPHYDGATELGPGHPIGENQQSAGAPGDTCSFPGAAIVQQYLRAGLIDDLHLVIAPVLLGDGERLFDHLGGGTAGYECIELISSPAATHARLARVGRHAL